VLFLSRVYSDEPITFEAYGVISIQHNESQPLFFVTNGDFSVIPGTPGKLTVRMENETHIVEVLPAASKEMVEEIVLLENGKQKTIDPKSEEGIGLASLLTRKLHELNLQARCVFSEEDIRGIKQKDRVSELVFMNPIDIRISQLVEPEERYHIPDEKGYRILKNVETALFILEDNLDEGLEAHILVGSERKDRDERCSWNVTEEDREKYKELGPIWSMIAGYEFDEERGCIPVGGSKYVKDVVPFKTKEECELACGKMWSCWTIEKGDEGLDEGWIDDVNKIISTEQ